MPPIVAIVGRPNVGKSTLFNRLIRRNKAITHDRPGVTRDRLFGEVGWGEVPFTVVDTGGLVLDHPDSMEEDILFQAREAVTAASMVVLVVDGREGPTGLDEQVAGFLRQTGKPVLLVVNKVDGPEREDMLTAEFHAFGFPIVAVSASHGYHTFELVEAIEERLPKLDSGEAEPQEEGAPKGLKVAFLGKPNAGKSSMVNALIGEHRLIVSPEAGTTRDSVDVTFERAGRLYTFVDTAGVRRRSKIVDSLERFSVLKALSTAKRADVTVLMIDALEGVTAQDKKLLDFLVKEKLPFLIAVNKIDLVERAKLSPLKKEFEASLKLTSYAPVAYTSTVTKAGLSSILPLAERIKSECGMRISTGQLNRAMREVIDRHQPPLVKHRRAKFYYLTQADSTPPTFVFFVNDEELVKPSYAKYLENGLRKLFSIRMAPITVVFRSSHDKDKD